MVVVVVGGDSSASSTLHAGGSQQDATLDGAREQTKVSAPVMNESWYGRPIEEVDPYIFEDTFCVISKKFDRHYIYRYSCSKSLFLFGPLNPIRKFAMCVTTHRWFDFLMIFTILCNCVTLAMITNIFDPTTDERIIPEFDVYIDYIEYVFLGIYTTELALKVMAKGLICNRFSYLRNRWNILDMIVVVSGYVSLIKDLQDNDDQKDDNELDFLRTFRVLRVFRTISLLPGLKMMINALLSSVVGLLEVMALTLVCLVIFSVFAMEVFQGRLRQKCVADKGGPMDPGRLVNRPIAEEDELDRDRLWTEWVNDWKNWKRRSFPGDEPVFCGNGSDKRPCGVGYTCIGNLGGNPDDGWTNFDTFFNSMLSTFQLLTLDYWERLYDIVVSTCGIWSLFFFMLVIFLGSYYLLNLMLAVVAMSYENEASVQKDNMAISAGEKLGLNRRQSNFSFDDLTKIHVCKMTQYIKRTTSERELRAKRLQEEDDAALTDQTRNAGRLDETIFSLLGIRLALKQDAEIDALDHGHLDEEEEVGTIAHTGKNEQSEVLEEVHSDVELDLGSKSASRMQLTVRSLVVSVNGWQHRTSMCLRRYLLPVVTHTIFDLFIMLCIVTNTVVLAMEHHDASQDLEDTLRLFNHVFMAIFTLEFLLKLMVLQGEYFQSGWNIFDMVIVMVNFMDLAAAELTNDTRSSGLSVIRSMRLLRVFKLAHSWVTMKVLLNIIFSSFGALGNLIAVLLIVIYIFAVTGMQVVGEQYSYAAFDALKNNSALPPWHWRHFWYAFNLVFRVLCGEWIEPLWECLKAQEHYINHPYGHGIDDPSSGSHFVPYLKCFVIFLPILIVGNFIVLNLFLALLLNSFDTEELNAQKQRELEASGRTEQLRNIVGLLLKRETTVDGEGEATSTDASTGNGKDEVDSPAKGDPDLLSVPTDTSGDPAGNDGKGKDGKLEVKGSSHKGLHVESAAKTRFKKAVNRVILNIRIAAAERAIARMENRRKKHVKVPMFNKLLLGNPAVKGAHDSYKYDETPESSVYSEDLANAGECIPRRILQFRLCPCKPRNTGRRKSTIGIRQWESLRSVCVTIVRHSAFEYTILFLIFASSITLCFEDIHLDENPKLKAALCYINYAITAVFCLEMVLKWFAIGIWGYFTNFWTILDAFIVTVSLISLYFDLALGTCADSASGGRAGAAANLGALKALRTLRALRPLRAISRWEGMKIVVNALFYAIPSIFNVLLVCLLFWLIFSIMGVQFFKGQFFRCIDKNGERVDAKLVPNKDVCCAKAHTHKYSWTNTISNYDNVFEGYLSLLQIATFEGWTELISYSVDAVGVDKQPVTDSQIGYYAFYVVFIVFGSFFSLQLFIGVIIDNFNMLKKKYEGTMLEILLTPSQRNYYIAMKNLGKRRPKPIIERPKSKFFGFFYDIASSRKLEVIIFIMIFLNVVSEAFEDYGIHQHTMHISFGGSVFFTAVYCLEAFIKIVGLGAFYFTVPWNVYDFVLVGASVIDTFIELTVTLPVPATMLRVVRVIRIGRILRLIKAAKGIRKLMFALVVSLPALFNIGALLSLITFIYAILGMTLFGRVARKWSVDDVFNFETFLNSNLMLLRLMTAAGWNEVLDSLTVIEPVCGSYRHIKCGLSGEPDCPNRGLVVAYIVSYLILTYLIVINLYIAIILENYVDASNEEDVGIVEDDLEMFYIRWSRFDPHATQFISFEDLQEFLDSLDPPLRFRKPNIMAIVAFNLPISRGNKLHCLDILEALITHVLGQVDDSHEFRKLQGQMEHKFQKQFPSRRLLDIVSSTRRWKIEQNAAIIIQRAWRAYWLRKHPRVQIKPESNTKAQSISPGAKPSHGGIGHMMNRVGNVLSRMNTSIQTIKSAHIYSEATKAGHAPVKAPPPVLKLVVPHPPQANDSHSRQSKATVAEHKNAGGK